jgi:putative two-component system response regulator
MNVKHYTQNLRLLYVEDDEAIASRLLSILKSLFREVHYMKNGRDGLEAYGQIKPHLILSDISMPMMNGIAMCQAIKSVNPKQRFIFSTAHSESALLMQAIALNVDGYLVKPINHQAFLDLLGRVCKDIQVEIEHRFYQSHLEKLVDEKTSELQNANIKLMELNDEIQKTLESTILSLGGMAESRSHETGLHVQRVAKYAEFIGVQMGLSESEVDILRIVSPMHDIGKIAIEDHILKKPGKLSPDEYNRMKQHATLGYEMLKNSNLELFKYAAIVAHEHHEKWDGSGYPRGVSGDNIDVFGRIVAFADVFDALISERVYKKAWPVEKIIALAKEESGHHFDPKIVDIFLSNIDFFTQINERFSDRGCSLYM